MAQSSSQSDGISRGIVKFNQPALKTVCPAFDWNRPDHLQGLADLKATLIDYPRALGLAANQINFLARVFVMRLKGKVVVCANPQVVQASGITDIQKEECMSFPGLFVQVQRPLAGEVTFDEDPTSRTMMKLHGWDFRCFLHELQHLEGITISSLKREGKNVP